MKGYLDKILAVIIVIISCVVTFIFQTQKVGFHEDEVYTLSSSVSPINGLLSTFDTGLEWYSKEYVNDYFTLKSENILNFKALYNNQKADNHPPFFYTLVHFSSLLFGGKFNKYTVFVVNIIAFIISCFIIYKILNLIKKPHLILGTLLLYGLSMGTISLIIFQRMYMLLTMFILLYVYYSLKLYCNKYSFTKKDLILLGITTVLGFLTQYFFVMFVFFVFIILLIDMFKKKLPKKTITQYFVTHVISAVFAVLSFTPSIGHLLFSDRGISNLGNSGFLNSLKIYINHLAYAFSINTHIILIVIALVIGLAICYIVKNKDKVPMLVFLIPSICFFIISVHFTSFKELRYILPIVPYVCMLFMMAIDNINIKKLRNRFVYLFIALILVGIGFIYSKPKFLYKNYQEKLDIAEKYKDYSYVYITDNLFCHIQSVPEMMIYRRSLFIDYNNKERKEFEYLVSESGIDAEEAFVLSLKNYMDNDKIINEILEQTTFTKAKVLYKYVEQDDSVQDNLYFITK